MLYRLLSLLLRAMCCSAGRYDAQRLVSLPSIMPSYNKRNRGVAVAGLKRSTGLPFIEGSLQVYVPQVIAEGRWRVVEAVLQAASR